MAETIWIITLRGQVVSAFPTREEAEKEVAAMRVEVEQRTNREDKRAFKIQACDYFV